MIEDARNNFIADNLAVLCANRYLKELSLWSERLKAIDKQEQPQITPDMIKDHWRSKRNKLQKNLGKAGDDV